MFFKLFLLFAIIPVIEIAILVKVGTVIGAWPTILLVIATAAIGAYLVRMEGLSIMTRLQKNLSQGVFPAEELMDGALVLVAGAVLLTPGIMTDILGFLLVFPLTRQLFKGIARKLIKGRMVMGGAGSGQTGFGGFGGAGSAGGGSGFGGFGGTGTGGSHGRSSRRSVPTYEVEAEVVEEGDKDDSDDTKTVEGEWENPKRKGK